MDSQADGCAQAFVNLRVTLGAQSLVCMYKPEESLPCNGLLDVVDAHQEYIWSFAPKRRYTVDLNVHVADLVHISVGVESDHLSAAIQPVTLAVFDDLDHAFDVIQLAETTDVGVARKIWV